MMGFGMGMWGLGALVMIAFWVIVIGGAAWLVLTLVRGNQPQPATNQSNALVTPSAPTQTPLDILKMRYAKGEITPEQFEQMKHDLGNG